MKIHLDQPVPPMMLQTLVENAIKHGISKKIKGGIVKIISRFTNDHFELIVQNTGYTGMRAMLMKDLVLKVPATG